MTEEQFWEWAWDILCDLANYIGIDCETHRNSNNNADAASLLSAVISEYNSDTGVSDCAAARAAAASLGSHNSNDTGSWMSTANHESCDTLIAAVNTKCPVSE